MMQPHEVMAIECERRDIFRNSPSPGKFRKVISEENLGYCRRAMSHGTNGEKHTESGQVLIEDTLELEGMGELTATLLPDCLIWHRTDILGASLCWRQAETSGKLLLSEIYAVEMIEMNSFSPFNACGLLSPLPQRYHQFAVHTFQRSDVNNCQWIPKVYLFATPHQETCQSWVDSIQELLNNDTGRPRNLLVLVNPFGGKGLGLQQWESVAPLFERAQVKTKVVLTQKAGHAHDLMADATAEELKNQDGVVVVGGDGLFNEVLNGLVGSRHKARPGPKPQRVAEILAKTSSLQREAQKTTTELRESQWDSQAHTVVEYKQDLCDGLADVNSPLLPQMAVGLQKSSASNVDSQDCPLTTGFRHSRSLELSDCLPQGAKETLVYCPSVRSIELSTSTKHETVQGVGPLVAGEGDFIYPLPIAEEPMIFASEEGRPSKAPELSNLVEGSLLSSNPHLRIGIIPAGSTDTIAISTTGSRDAVTAALHILLGDCMPLDIVKITSWKSSPKSTNDTPQVRYAASFAGYGFYGDVMKESELCRWMGPARYDIAGFKVFMRHKTYEAEVSFLEIPQSPSVPTPSVTTRDLNVICRANCAICAGGMDLNHLIDPDMDNEESCLELKSVGPRWRTIRDTFQSVGAAVMSCRNEKAPDGVAAHAHLADGLLNLILIRKCSRPSYLRQLLRLTRRGADPLNFDFVEHYKTPVFTFISHGDESVWNVDGELFPAHQLSAQVFRGLVNVFARGPEI